jgi:hypothetical protein
MKGTKLFLTFLLFAGLSSLLQAQTGINYQGLARRASGAPVADQNIKLKLSIRDLTVSGTVVYTETRNSTTNKFGLFNVVIGSSGAASQYGTLAGVNWATGAKFLQVELDPDGGNNFVDMGTTQLQAVPYALFASAAAPGGTAAGDLSGTYPNPAVAKIQGKAVSATAPTANQILKFDGTIWAPANEGGLSVGAVATSATPNAASVTNGVLNLAPADASNAGIVSTGTQSFTGAKTFSSGLTVTTKPFLPTKLSSSQISALTGLQEGMVVYNTDTRKLQLYSVGNSDVVNDLFSGNFSYRKDYIVQSFVPPTNGNITAIQLYAKSPAGYPNSYLFVNFEDATNNYLGGSNFNLNNLSSSGQWYTAELMSPIPVTAGTLMRFALYGDFDLYYGDVVLGTNSNYSNGSIINSYGAPGSNTNGDDLMFKILVTPTNGTNAYWLNLN